MKLRLTPVPSRFARPIAAVVDVGPVDMLAVDRHPPPSKVPVPGMKFGLTPVPSRFARPMPPSSAQ